jgi:hypothetical protein
MSQILTRAHDELYKRTADERFATMQDLWDSCHARKERSELLWRSADDLLAIPRERRLELATTPIDSHRMNSWSFGQLCGIAGVSRDTVNRLTPETAAKVFEETMPKGGKPMQLYTDGDLIRSIHGASYTRLHDVELLTMLKEFATDFVPPQESGAPGSSGGCGLSFYRDKDGVEADLVVEDGGRMTAIEAKAAATASRSLFDGAGRVRGLLETTGREVESIVVYGGDESQKRSASTLTPWDRLHEHCMGR